MAPPGYDDERPLSLPDLALWDRVTESVRPLPGRVRSRRTETSRSVVDHRKPSRSDGAGVGADGGAGAGAAQVERQSRQPEQSLRSRSAASDLWRRAPEMGPGNAPDIDRRTLVRLRRGRMPVDGVVDLHGHTQEEAHRLLESFLAGSQLAGRRCVLVVTGKGTRSEGVLRRSVPRWLNQAPNRDRVLAFAYASAGHGGEGALYVLLKRRRTGR